MKRQQVLNTVEDLVGKFLYYDRKEDEDLPRGAIDVAVSVGDISVDEIVEQFRTHLVKGLET